MGNEEYQEADSVISSIAGRTKTIGRDRKM